MAWRIFQVVRQALNGLLPAEAIYRIDVKAVKSGPISIRLKKKRNDELFVVMSFSSNGEHTWCKMDVKEFTAVIDAMLVTKSVIHRTQKNQLTDYQRSHLVDPATEAD